MPIRLVILDCDRTLWDHPDVSTLHLPVRRVDPDTAADATGVPVRLSPGARGLLEGLRARGILISIASWNPPEPVLAILEALGLVDYFTAPRVEPHPHKDRMVAAVLRDLEERGTALAPEEVLFVDDREAHLQAVRAAVGPVRTLQAGRDVTDLRQVLAHVDEGLPG